MLCCLQLGPVMDKPLFTKTTMKKSSSENGPILFKEFKMGIILKTSMRQDNSQQMLTDVINRKRDNNSTKEDVTWLQQFQRSALIKKFGEEAMIKFEKEAVYIAPYHKQIQERNAKALKELNRTSPVLKWKSINKGSCARDAPTDKAMGLPKTLNICKGAKVKLTNNLVVGHGLFNGAIGEVKEIICSGGNEGLPDYVIVQFPNYGYNRSFIPDHPKLVPIVPVERRIDCMHGCRRMQFPLG